MATRQTSKSLDDEVPRKFVMLSVSGRRETFASGDESSLRFLKRRLLRSNFAFSPDATRRRLPRPRSFSELAAAGAGASRRARTRSSSGAGAA